MNNVVNIIKQRLSLREPLAEALDVLSRLVDRLTLTKPAKLEDKEADETTYKQYLQDELQKVQEICPSCKDFERDFPSFAFSIATGIGKTRLMGACIAYLYLKKGIRHFFILAPNLTLYEKLMRDFGDPSYEKYVFRGISEFVHNEPHVITGVIKANIPSRIAFAVSSQVDSRTILDSGGAEKLLGKGDMLFFPVGAAKPTRIQGCFVSDKEVEKVVAFIKGSQTAEYDDQILEEIERQAEAAGKSAGGGSGGGGFDAQDEMLPAAIECVVETGQASTSLLQRKLKLGYARAARIIDEMESRGIVGPFEGSKPRQVLISRQQWIEMKMQEDGTAPQAKE